MYENVPPTVLASGFQFSGKVNNRVFWAASLSVTEGQVLYGLS